MKRCKCEHWQQCPICMPHRFDAEGNLLPPEPPPLEAARAEIKRLHAVNQELLEALKDVTAHLIAAYILRAGGGKEVEVSDAMLAAIAAVMDDCEKSLFVIAKAEGRA